MDSSSAEDHRLNEEGLQFLISELKKKVKSSKFAGSVIPRTDSAFLVKFIRTKDYDLDAAFTAIGKYYACVQRNLDIITDLTPSRYEKAFRSQMVLPLRHCFNGSRVAIFRVKDWLPKEVGVHGVELMCLFVAEQYISKCFHLQLKGVEVVIDLEGVRFEHARTFSVKELRRIIHTAQDGIPVRIAGIHLLHLPPFVWPLFKVMMRVLKEKIRRRVHLHSSFESLHQHLNKENLPQSLGGDLSEEDAIETNVVDNILVENIPFEKYWNGALEPNPPFPFEQKVEDGLMIRQI